MMPYYSTTTELHYGHDLAPDLYFSRTATRINEKSDEHIERKVKRGERKIEKLEQKSMQKDGNFAGMTNVEFDVLFGALNRTDELQFRQMYTSVGQEQTLKLILADEAYGDDFDFVKNGKLNTVSTQHTQFRALSLGAEEYCSYDISLAEQAFIGKNEAFFKAVYFDFAPLLCVPSYQEPLVRSEALRCGGLSLYNYEELAYKFRSRLAPDGAVTESIFKVEKGVGNGVQMRASAYRTEPRCTYVRTLGGDGHFHNVPVHWEEYIPIQSHGVLTVSDKWEENTVNYGGYYVGCEE
jgi:hypothetical protein